MERKSGVGSQNPLMQSAQLRSGFDAELIDQDAARLIEHCQRLCLPIAEEEGEHELAAQAFVQRVFPDQLRERAGQVGVPAKVVQGVEPQPFGLKPARAPVLGRIGEFGPFRHVGQRFAAPERQRLGRQVGRPLPVGGFSRLTPRGFQRREQADIQLLIGEVEQVSVGRGAQPRGHFIAKDVTKPFDLVVQRLPGQPRWFARPQRVDQSIGGDRGAGVQKQRREQRPPAIPHQRYGGPLVLCGQRPEHPEPKLPHPLPLAR